MPSSFLHMKVRESIQSICQDSSGLVPLFMCSSFLCYSTVWLVVQSHVSSLCMLPAVLISQESCFYYFFSVCRTSFSHHLRIGVQVTISLNFPSFENMLILPSFLKDIITGIEFWMDSSFFSSLDKLCATCKWLSWLLIRYPWSFELFLYRWYAISL